MDTNKTFKTTKDTKGGIIEPRRDTNKTFKTTKSTKGTKIKNVVRGV